MDIITGNFGNSSFIGMNRNHSMMDNHVITFLFIALLLCSCHNDKTVQSNNGQKSEQASGITAEMAYEGISNYCHGAYDWSIAENNPSMMYVKMGDETETEYQVVFRSYTGALVYFYVSKTNGRTRMVEYVPDLDVKNEIGTIDLFDYLK